MKSLEPLPGQLLGTSFTVEQANRIGVSERRLRGSDLARPFWGVRSKLPDSFSTRVDAFALRLEPGQCFSGVTASRYWGLPVPFAWTPHERIVVAVPHHTSRRRTVGVTTHEYSPHHFRRSPDADIPVFDPIATCIVMARELDHLTLTTFVDALLTNAPLYPGLRLPARPFCDPEGLIRALERHHRVPGAARLKRALARARVGAESPWETRTRLALVDAGLPEPTVQHQVWHRGRLIAVLDLAYADLRIDIEYEGDHHRSDPAQWDRDIERQRILARLGWTVVRVTRRDLGPGGNLVQKVAEAIALSAPGAAGSVTFRR